MTVAADLAGVEPRAMKRLGAVLAAEVAWRPGGMPLAGMARVLAGSTVVRRGGAREGFVVAQAFRR